MNSDNKEAIMNLRKNSKLAYVSSIDGAGFPTIKAMLLLEPKGLKTIYFSTNTSSKRVKQFRNYPKSSVYLCDEKNYRGVLLTGTMQVRTDVETKTRMWREGFEMYYPKGIDDDDYCVLEFTAERGNHYHGLTNEDFSLDEFE